MAKTTVYQITQEGMNTLARTLKNVEEITGNKHTKKDIEADKIAGVEVVELELTEEQVEQLEDVGIVDLQENKEELEMTKIIEQEVEEIEELTIEIEEDIEEVEEDIEEVEELTIEIEEDIEEVEEEVILTNQDGKVIEGNEEVPTATVEEPEEIEDVEEPSLDDLLARLQANNEKIAKENPEKIQRKKRGSAVVLETDEDGNVEYPDKGYFKDEDHIKKYYKQLSDEQLDEWIELEGLEYNPNDHAGINRMRKCVAIREYHFPTERKAPKKSKSKYADYSTEDLLEMALENDVEVRDAKGNLRILRMYCIMALREAGIIE